MMKVLWLIYNLLLPVVLILAAPSYLTRMRRRGQAGYRWKERFGFFDSAVQQRLKRAERPIWIHAVSVGEVKLAEVLIRELRRERPQQEVILSTTTITGRRLAEAMEDENLTVIFHTVDLWLCVKRVFDLIQPAMVVLVEQELWPNQLVLARQRRVPVWVVNARLSDRSRRRFARFRSWMRPLLEMLDFIGVQSEQEIERFSSCGFPPHKLFNTGSMKFDVVPEINEERQRDLKSLMHKLGWSDQDLVILGGSTHGPEEAMLLRVCGDLVVKEGVVRVVLVPRHAERAAEMQTVCLKAGKSFVLKSELDQDQNQAEGKQAPEVLIVDTTGELAAFYGVANINIIGKSFYGIGGQNFLEAARFPHPIVVGPEMSNFRDTVECFKSQQALIQVQDEQELRRSLQELVQDESLRSETGQRACGVMQKNCGAAGRQAAMIVAYLAATEMG